MSDGQSDYLREQRLLSDAWRDLYAEYKRPGFRAPKPIEGFPPTFAPIVPRRDGIWAYVPPYHWLGKEAEAA